MECEYFQKCGGCSLGGLSYDAQLYSKIQVHQVRFKEYFSKKFEIISSKQSHFRNRAEFRIYHKDGMIHYAMHDFEKKILPINQCPMVVHSISSVMPLLLQKIQSNPVLKYKLYAVEFLSANLGDMLVTLIYHKKLDESWDEVAKELEKDLNINIIGRARKQKRVLSRSFIQDSINVDQHEYKMRYYEGGFTQPNQEVNSKMIQWVSHKLSKTNKDLCELYCGGGNFTIALSKKFAKVLATEISKSSIKAAKQNCELNGIDTIKFIRMSSEEFTQALNKQREFRRLIQQGVDLDQYEFETIFVDPPRAGLDQKTLELVAKFDTVVYISCNPQTLYNNLASLCKTHTVEHFAFFDQFVYTKHIECGVILKKKIVDEEF